MSSVSKNIDNMEVVEAKGLYVEGKVPSSLFSVCVSPCGSSRTLTGIV